MHRRGQPLYFLRVMPRASPRWMNPAYLTTRLVHFYSHLRFNRLLSVQKLSELSSVPLRVIPETVVYM